MRAKPIKVFIVLTGVNGNLGDAVIRRRVYEWFGDLGEVHAYVGNATPGWLGQLHLRDTDHVYSAAERRQWLTMALFGRGRRVLIFDPGELPLGRDHLWPEARSTIITGLMRLRGSRVIRPPRAVAHYTASTAAVARIGARMSSVTMWRTRASIEAMRTGEFTPDTAFSEPIARGKAWAERDLLVISPRGESGYSVPSSAWFEAVREFAATHSLNTVVVSQVDQDEARARVIADSLGADTQHLDWGGRTDSEQEVRLRDLYQQAAYVVSERLHVLILAAMAGAIPVEVAENRRPKVRDHFEAIGVSSVSFEASGKSSADILGFLNSRAATRPELQAALRLAHVRLCTRVDEVRSSLGASPVFRALPESWA